VPRVVEEPPPSRPAYFWWLLANALALCFAITSWVVCLNVFGSPETARNYAILKKLGRSPVLKHYTVLDVPAGNSLTPKELYGKYMAPKEEDRKELNTLLMRNYLKNFDSPLLLMYVEGDYQISGVKELGGKDFLDPGVVVRAQALVKPDDFTKPTPYPVFIEYILPSADVLASSFKVGDILSVKKSPHCAAVIHVEKIVHEDDPALLLTVIPIAYGPYEVVKGNTFRVEPPVSLRPGAGFPIFKN